MCLVVTVTIIQTINFVAVYIYGLDFLNWWPLQKSKLFHLGGLPDSVLSANISGLSIDILIPGLEQHLKTYWLTRHGLALITLYLFIAVLASFKRMLKTVNIDQPFDFKNIKRVQIILGLILFEIFVLDYWRTESMKPVKALVEQMNSPIVGSDSSYQNADAYAYILVLLLLTLLSIFRRGISLYQEQRKTEQLLFQKKKLEAVGTLASGVGHDFNNILTTIVGYASIAKSESDLQNIQFALDRVLEATSRGKRLTQQIRAIGGQPSHLLDEEIVELKDEINEFIVSVTPTIPKNIKVFTDFEHGEKFTVAIDPTKMYQVLLNLFTNAIQAIEDKEGTIVIELKEHWHQNKLGYLIEIKDSGCGMDLTLQSKIFEPYFTTRYQKGGTGLGLALCQSIINGYKGHIEIKSALNQGSAFSIWLPKASSKAI